MDNNLTIKRQFFGAKSHEKIVLGPVQETLLIPLYLRAKETQRPDAICRDPKAVEIIAGLDYDFSPFNGRVIHLDVAIRTEIFDEIVLAFLKRHPDSVVVNLGAGLDARFERLDNGRVLWFDVDLPDSIEFRKRFFQESERNRFIAASFSDPDWMDDVDQVRGVRPVLILAEGLFCYLDGEEIRGAIRRYADRWPGAELAFQSISPEYVNKQGSVPAVRATKAVFKWGIRTGKELESWSPDYHFLEEWAVIDRHFRRWGALGWACKFIPWAYRRVHDVIKISHVRLGEARS